MKRLLLFLFYTLSAAIVFAYLLACFTPYISPATWWPMGFLSLLFPYLFLLVCGLTVLFIWVKKKLALAIFLLLFVGYKNMAAMLALNSNSVFTHKKKLGAIRILGWNVKDFETKERYFDSANSIRHKMFAYIAAQNADILCLQDFNDYPENKKIASNLLHLRDSLHYPYYYNSADYIINAPWGRSEDGVAIFSKIPLINFHKVLYKGKNVPESMILADVEHNGKTCRLMVTHLQSMHLSTEKNPGNQEPWNTAEDTAINYGKSKFIKLKYYQPYHALQAAEIKKQLALSPYPIIFSVDMNEVPTSFCYHLIAHNLEDAFLQKGFGLGPTYYQYSPTLRIDYLLLSPSIKILQYKKDNIYLSDHYPQLIDVEW